MIRMRTGLLLLLVSYSKIIYSANYGLPLGPGPEEIAQRIELLKLAPNPVINEYYVEDEEDEYFEISGNYTSIDPTTFQEFVTNFYFYKTKIPGIRPAVIMAPTIHGITLYEKSFARFLAKNGLHVIISDVPDRISDVDRHTDDIDNFLIRSTLSLMHSFELLQNFGNVDKSKINAFGSSLGGIRVSLFAGIEQRLNGIITVVAGGHIAEILASSQQKIINRYRDFRMEAEEFESDLDFFKKLQKSIKYDPLYFADRVPKNKLVMFMSREDQDVPSPTQFKLWKYFHGPKSYIFSGGHKTAILRSYFYKSKILDLLYRF
ncbi:MAG: hypothetical protein H6622_16775 [Halobacteriovoraceae bacterium]|nr:hypothetical protein [Halobacteriovoraceae bacterium]